ncbi:hypothetical protein RRG08_058137 [Elysia crispata]|uniref:Uncharacterized protein n=1 Tax=Elysia crispata TaxID=231223 RepID=A0AAE1AG09_9GAST|nr:hypothetical protein RRG08_058137 [Elysia crispata]
MFKFTTDKTLPTIRLEFLGFSEMRRLYVRTGNTCSSSQLYELLRAPLSGLSNPCGMSEKPYYTQGTMTSASQLPIQHNGNFVEATGTFRAFLSSEPEERI